MSSNSSSEQNPIRIFVGHGFQGHSDFVRVFEYLESARNFFYKNCSILDAGVTTDLEAKRQLIRKQIDLSEVALFPAGMYAEYREWFDFEIQCAREFEKPVVLVDFFGVKQKLPVQLEALANEKVQWNERELVDAVRRQARHEETSRWDVIEFKLD